MVTNYYNASNHFSKPVRKEPPPYRMPADSPEEKKTPCKEQPCREKEESLRAFSVDADATLLGGLVLLLFVSGCRDKWLLAALLYLLLF